MENSNDQQIGVFPLGLPAPKVPPRIPDRLKNEVVHVSNIEGSEIYVYHGESKLLGHGAFSLVFQGYFQHPENKAAVKRVTYETEEQAISCSNELSILETIASSDDPRKEFLVHFYGSAIEVNRVYLAMELADRTLKHELLYKFPDSNTREKIVCGYMRNVFAGLEFLHKIDIIHRDIKPENILIFENSLTGEKTAKLGDFGLSRELSESMGSISLGRGTLTWMAKEALDAYFDGSTFLNTKAMDIFSLGMVGSHTISGFGKHPFELDHGAIQANIRKPNVLPDEIIQMENRTAHNLYIWMMQKNAERRPTISQCRAHPYLWERKEDKCAQFFTDVVKCLENPNHWKYPMIVRDSLDYAYIKHSERFKNEFIWSHEKYFDENVTKARFKKKRYYTSSVVSLLQFIVDIMKSPTEEEKKCFGENGVFNSGRFVKHVLDKFEHLLIIVFCLLATVAERYMFLKNLKEKYFKELCDCREGWNWKDDLIEKTIKDFLVKVKYFDIMIQNPCGPDEPVKLLE